MSARSKLHDTITQAAGASTGEAEELARYDKRHFGPIDSVERLRFPLPDEEFVQVWECYEEQAAEAGTIEVLARYLPHLRFPIQDGISRTSEYLNAMIAWTPGGTCRLALQAPRDCKIGFHPTPAGRIPVITAVARPDFEALLRALAWSSEPAPVASTVDAVIVSGFQNPHRAILSDRTSPRRDRFLIVHAGEPYAGIPPAGAFSPREWLHVSTRIRCEHLSAHYFSRRILGSMSQALLDEVIAHFYGVVCVLGEYRADLLLDFMGIKDGQPGARWKSYKGDVPLSDGALRCLLWIVGEAARNLEAFQKIISISMTSDAARSALLLTLFAFTLEELAGPESSGWLLWELERQMKIRNDAEPETEGEL